MAGMEPDKVETPLPPLGASTVHQTSLVVTQMDVAPTLQNSAALPAPAKSRSRDLCEACGGRGCGMCIGAVQVDGGMEPTELQFDVLVDRSNGASLGLSLDGTDGRSLVITVIEPGGLVHGWNEAHPAKQACEGSRIISVNGISGDAPSMAEEVQKLELLTLTVFQVIEPFNPRLSYVCRACNGQGCSSCNNVARKRNNGMSVVNPKIRRSDRQNSGPGAETWGQTFGIFSPPAEEAARGNSTSSSACLSCGGRGCSMCSNKCISCGGRGCGMCEARRAG